MTERRGQLKGWGEGDRERLWWKRGYDPIGRHTMVAVILGVVMAALIGATLDPLNLRTSDDLKRAEQAAYETAYAKVEAEGVADGIPYGRVQYLGKQIVTNGDGIGSDYGQEFGKGWIVGWNEALDAMRESAVAVGLPAGYTEFRVLDQMERR